MKKIFGKGKEEKIEKQKKQKRKNRNIFGLRRRKKETEYICFSQEKKKEVIHCVGRCFSVYAT